MANNHLDDIIRENAPRLRRYVRSRVENSDDADDIVQDTFYQFLRTISIIDNPIGQVTAWLYTVAHNLVINHGKRAKTRLTVTKPATDDDRFMADLSDIMVASDNDAPDISMLRSLVWEELDNAMGSLSKEQRMAIEMTELQGLSVKEAAKKMGVSVNTFLSRKHYAVVHIRKQLKDLYEELVRD